MHTINPAAESVAALLRLVSAAALREVPAAPLTVRSYSCGACGLVRQHRGECARCA
jgi:hypothetical protein